MSKLTKKDFKNNSFNIFLCAMYSIIVAVVYGYWMNQITDRTWVAPTIVVFALLSGIVAIILTTILNKKKTV